jgi:hypothetical protein
MLVELSFHQRCCPIRYSIYPQNKGDQNYRKIKERNKKLPEEAKIRSSTYNEVW